MLQRNKRKEMAGVVVSDKAEKTITVLVETYKNHALYKKRVKYSKKYLVHDEKQEAKIGDKVEVMETKPLSKRKRFRLTKVVEKAVG